jgi:superfamily II DNA or RNA helicase
MGKIEIYQLDAAQIRVACDSESTMRELTDYFTFDSPNKQWSPAYKSRKWDGKIRLLSQKTGQTLSGLVGHVMHFAGQSGDSIKAIDFLGGGVVGFNDENAADFMQGLHLRSNGKEITSHPHQIQGFGHAIRTGRSILLSPTSSGKSVIAYAMARYYQQQIFTDKANKILIMVPTVQLVDQLYSDFADYSSAIKWNVEDHCHKIYEGQLNTSEKQIYISTWQSIYKLPKKYFEQFGVVIGDECHRYEAQSAKRIMTSCIHAYRRHGMTGTLRDLQESSIHRLVLEGLYGPVKQVITTKEMIDKKISSGIQINCLRLSYPEHDRKVVCGMRYPDEMDFICAHNPRSEFVTDLACKLRGNTLMLFQYIDKHGKTLKELMESKLAHTGRSVYYVDGSVPKDTREEIRSLVEKEDDAVIIASYGTFSTGINIRRLHNIIMASPTKAPVTVKQSIGRGLRKAEDKEIVTVYDIADDLSYKIRRNFALSHFRKRVEIYISESHPYRVIPIDLTQGTPNAITRNSSGKDE